jgi:DNA-binding GntR family transcriptional regulator
VLTAIERRDGPRARDLMAATIREFRDELVRRLQDAAPPRCSS